MIEYILFDLDGTLTDSAEGITNSVAYALDYFGITTEDKTQLRKFIGPPLKQSFINFYGFDYDKAELAVAKYREYYGPKGVLENRVYDGIIELLELLKSKGYKLVVATSKPEIYAKQIAKHFDFDKYFEAVCGSELNGDRTNKAEVIKYAINMFDIDTNKAVMIGDRKHDMEGASKNGLKSIGVLFGFGSRDELEKYGANYIAENVIDIANIIDSIDKD